jgi:cell division protease FtsH
MLGHLSTGAADDLARATQIAREMIMRYGMDEELGCVSHDSNRHPPLGTPEILFTPQAPPVSESTLQKIDAAIGQLLAQSLRRATDVLLMNQALLEHCSQTLLKAETLDEQALRVLTAGLHKEPMRP